MQVFPPSARIHALFFMAFFALRSVSLLSPQDILYLPSLWYHRVSQKGVTVAVNYWHDMQFDHKYVYYRFLQGLAKKCRGGGRRGTPFGAASKTTELPPVASEVEGGENGGSAR